MEKIKIRLPIMVEGKYDKITLSSIFDAKIFTLGGFGIFNSKEKQALLRAVCRDGVILLLDSDAGGKQIRAFLNSILPKDKIHNLYIPQIEGKERRKRAPSRSGRLGVEGMSREVLTEVLSPFAGEAVPKCGELITKLDFYLDGLSGGEGAREKREKLALSYNLPPDMTANALLEALNIISEREEYKNRISELFGGFTVPTDVG